jgi:hypothetical protein
MFPRHHLNSAMRVLLLLFSVSIAASAQSEADWDWVNKHFGKALHDLFPNEQRAGMYVAYRSHRDLYTNTPEYSFLIGRDAAEIGLQPYLSAHVRQADSTSVYDQMMDMHRKAPNTSAEDVQKAVRVKVWDLTEMSCPAVKSQFVKFRRLRLATPQFDVVIIHPLIHEFHIRAGSGDMEITLYDGENSFVAWAIETRHALESCVKKTP